MHSRLSALPESEELLVPHNTVHDVPTRFPPLIHPPANFHAFLLRSLDGFLCRREFSLSGRAGLYMHFAGPQDTKIQYIITTTPLIRLQSLQVISRKCKLLDPFSHSLG